MIVKKAEKEDLRAILDLQYLAYQSEAKLYNDPDIPPLKQTLSEVEREFQRGIILKALDHRTSIIGSVRGYGKNGTAYIGKLMVHPEYQGQGIGSRLLSEIEKEFPQLRYELFTGSRSRGNIRLYERHGYRIFREEKISDDLTFVYLEKEGGHET